MWHLSHRCDPDVRPLADRHYSRQSIGAKNFVQPGRALVLKHFSLSCAAYWVTAWPSAEYTKHAWPGLWQCAAFRREAAPQVRPLATEMIVAALAVTRWYWAQMPNWRCDPEPPDGMITMIDPTQVPMQKYHGRDVWGLTFRRVGFREVGCTGEGLIVMQLMLRDFPAAARPMLTTLEDAA